MAINLATKKREYEGAPQALILAAERLIAENGASQTSLRQILNAAGVRNMSAVQYHFGSREELIEAIYLYRAERIGIRRDMLVEEMKRTNRMTDQRALVEVLVKPLAAELEESGGQSFYCRFLASRLSGNPLAPPPHMRARWVVFEDALAATLAYLPNHVVEVRIMMIRNLITAALAELEGRYSSDRPTAQLQSEYRFSIELLIDGAVAMLVGPISADVMGAMSGGKGG